MEHENLIAAKEFCMYHNIEYSFIHSLKDSGLISVTKVQKEVFIPEEEMQKVEKFIRLHYDLEINVEGLETIHYLLEKMEKLQEEIRSLKNKEENHRF
ncbi:MAG: chaperone modulator CbpM [Ginsengibacter sp.]